MQAFEIIALDVWGNSIDGFNVNQAFRTGNFLSLSEDFDDAEVHAALIAADTLHDHVTVDEIAVVGDIDFELYIEDALTGEPLWNLRSADAL